METPNPYQSPKDSDSSSVAPDTTGIESEPTGQEDLSRPWGIYVVAAAMAFAAILSFLATVRLASYRQHLYRDLDMPALHRSFAIDLAIDLIVVASLVGIAIGLCLGHRWSWWLASFYWGQEIAWTSVAIVHYEIVTIWPPPLILLARLVWGLLFFIYLFHGNVRVYFRCANIRLWIVGISLVIAILAVHGLWIGIQRLNVL